MARRGRCLAVCLCVWAGTSASAETLQGKWKLVAAEDLRPDGSVARHPWGLHPIGFIVVEKGSCYVQIMASDVPDFPASPTSVTEQMKTALLTSYIAYTGPCSFDDAAGTTTMKVEAAWRPDYVGTEQTRYYRFEANRLFYGPAPNSIRRGEERLTRRLTLERP
jgi:Lipocalin-like domain